MATFKVICKAPSDNWVEVPAKTRIVTKSWLFGLITTTGTITENMKTHGPSKEEVCIVTDDYMYGNEKYYKLAGYIGGYNAKYFVRLDEFIETQKEIARKSEPSLS